jgi:hypothetical protein
MTPLSTATLGTDWPDDYFKEFCNDIFRTLYRVDQRRAGKTYLHGLLNCPGRKSIRRMAAMTPGCHSEQSLQQFVNQSPWDHEPIRQRLMNYLVQALRPQAWVIEEVAFPKHGRYSAAVERQYVRSLEKVCNCQLSIVVTMASDQFNVPVNWRLIMPDSWGHDEERRARARIPDHVRPRPYWEYQVEVLDDMALDWGMPTAPIVLDARQLAKVESLLGALENRGLPYLAQVSGNLQVGYAVDRPRLVGGAPVMPLTARGPSWHGTVGDLVGKLRDATRATVSWQEPDMELTLRSQFLQVRVRSNPTDEPASRSAAPVADRQLIAEWPFAKPQPRGYWITNITDRSLADLVALARLRYRVGPCIEEFADRFGLRDYEGRTFTGWHHHVTLATAAYVFHVLTALHDEERCVAPVA